MKKIGIILDTNYFLHFKGIDSIPWRDIIGEGNYFFLITDPLIKELDSQKFNKVGKLRERAEKAIKNFFLWFDSSSTFSYSAEIHITQTDILKINFDELNLNKDDQDDNFIAYSIEVSKSSDYDEVFLLSNDFGMHRKAILRNLKTIRLNDEHKLPPPQSELEKENANLKNELLKLHNRQPKLKILFENGLDYVEHEVKEIFPLSGSEKQEIYNSLTTNFPYALKRKDKKESNDSFQQETSNSDLQELAKNFLAAQNSIAKFFAPTTEQLQKYDEELDQYFDKYIDFEQEKRNYESRKNRCVFFQFEINNTGGAMATNVQVNLHLPVSKQCELLPLREFEASAPEEPNPPIKPTSNLRNLDHILGTDNFMPRLYSPPRNIQARNVSRPTITPTNSFDIDFSIENLLHHTSEFTDKMVLIFPSTEEATSFTATYSLICQENPELTKGTLHFKVKRSSPLHS